MFASQAFDATSTLGPARRSLGIRRVARWLLRGTTVGAIAAVFVVVVGYVLQSQEATIVAALVLVAGMAGGLAAGVKAWPNNAEAARAVDRHFELADRATTALDLATHDSPIARLQRDDLYECVAGLPLGKSAGWHIRPLEVILCCTAIGLATVLASHVPSRGVAPVARPATANTDAQRIRHVAIIELPAIIRQMQQSLPVRQRQNQSLKELTAHLATLRQQLLHTATRRQALRAVSLTQLQLQQIATHLRPISGGAISRLNRSLGHLSPKISANTGSVDTSNDASAAARALNQLAAALAHMNQTQRAQLARALEQAANSASDARLRDALRRAASSLGYNDPRSAQRYLQQAANLLSNAPAQRIKQDAFKRADRALQRLKGRLAGDQPKTGAASNRQAMGRTSGSTASNRQGTETRNGSGQRVAPGPARNGSTVAVRRKNTGRTSGLVEGAGTTRAGRVTGGQTRVSGQGGHVTGDSQAGSTSRGQGRFAKVFVPGKQGRGPHVTQSGANSAPHQVQFIPYTQVVARYATSARNALEHSNLPPDVRAYVRQYFVAISH